MSAETSLLPAGNPTTEGVRAYLSPINRITHAGQPFDPVLNGRFHLETPPAGWFDLGYVDGFTRHSESSIQPVLAGSPALASTQSRKRVGATVQCSFRTWGKLHMAVTSGTMHMNLLAEANDVSPNGSGGFAASPVALATGSTASILQVATAGAFSAGDLIAVDEDYANETGFVGTEISGAYLQSGADVGSDPNFLRRITFNLARVLSVDGTAVTLAAPLLAGVPTPTMKAAKIAGFVDREGGAFFQEWSALFVIDGIQGDRLLFYYPRLQSAAGEAELRTKVGGTIESWALQGSFRALPVTDTNDGVSVVCFRSYLPAPMREV